MFGFALKIIGLFVSVLAISGCTLADIQEHGEACQNIAYVLSGNPYDLPDTWTECYSEDCKDYLDYVSIHFCPPASPYCVIDPNEGNYCTFACVRNSHQVISDEELAALRASSQALPEHLCEADDPSHCGSTDNDCSKTIPGWSDGTCEEKTCYPSQCKKSYRFDDYGEDPPRCVRYDQCCGIYCSVCTNNKKLDKTDPKYNHIICGSNQSEKNVECVSKCSEGFHACNGVCLPQKVTCTE